jgi:Gas vesicle synthesis protein GvpO
VPAEEQELTAATAARRALGQVEGLIAREPVGVTSVEPVDDGWMVEVEVLEERRIPSSSDMLALYAVELDLDGELLAYRRTRRYARGRVGSGNGVS